MEDVAKLASVWNLPVFGWYSMDAKMSDKSWYTTLIRTYASSDKTGDHQGRQRNLVRSQNVTIFQSDRSDDFVFQASL